MQTLVTRMLTTLSLILLLAVAAVAVRVNSWTTEMSLVEWPLLPNLYTLENSTPAAQTSLSEEFAAIELPELKLEVPVRHVASAPKRAALPEIKFQRVEKQINILDEVFSPVSSEEETNGEWRQIQGATKVPEFDSIRAEAVVVADVEKSNLLALAENFTFPQETMVASSDVEKKESVVDEVKTAQAKSEEVNSDPEFFEYQSEAQEVVAAKVVKKPEAKIEKSVDEYSLPEEIKTVKNEDVTTQSILTEENEALIAYNYIEAKPTKQLPKASVASAGKTKQVTTQVPKQEKNTTPVVNGFVNTQQATVVVAPIAVSTQLSSLSHFEIRAQDDGTTTLQDNGTGKVEIQEAVSGKANSRSFVLLANNYVPTHMDLPIAAGKVDIEVPVFDKETLAKYFVQPSRKPLGYLLVELDDETDSIVVDGVKPVETHFDGEFRKTTGSDFRYVLLSGVEVGNRLVTSIRGDGKRANRILHIHEEEVTFDPNLYGNKEPLILTLNEEDLLSKGHRDLVVSGDQVEMTFSGEKSQKLSPNVYKLSSQNLLLGARHYLTLTHQSEDIFVGVEKSGKVVVPSESLIREVIRKFGLNGNAQACLIQVNLDKAAKKYEVMAESHGQSHVSYGLVLDEDGQFYESMGENSRRLFIMSENQGGDEAARNAKINVRIEYQDGSKRSFASFCSANTYLVEQL